MPERSTDNTIDSTAANSNLFLVGIGASAGGLSALEELFDYLPSDSRAAYVVIQHLSPDFKSLMKELLERHTDMSVYRVTQGMKLQPNSVYLIPPGKTLTVEENILRLEERTRDKNDKHEFNFPIDLFFNSVAKNYGERAIGVILSGTGSDGTYGLRAINEAGGMALVQAPETAEFDGMPRSAIATEVVNHILPLAELAQLIYQCISSSLGSPDEETDDNNFLTYANLKQVAQLLLKTDNIDFSHYKPSTMSRRIHRRRLIHNFSDVASYIDLLRNSLEERKTLVSDLLINVTHFFRDTEAWEHIEHKILPELIDRVQPYEELRFWIAGCSTGEEAYSLAILVHEALENIPKSLTVKIFATDIDRTALEKASQGIYPQSIIKDITQARLQKYFIFENNCYQVMRKLREMLIFSPHDLTRDAGFTRMNLVSCRNVLIYMQNNLQQQVLRNFHFSLAAKGILFLGEAESTGVFESEFNPVHKKWKTYQKRRDVRLTLPVKNLPQITANSLRRSFKSQVPSKIPSLIEASFLRQLQESKLVVLLVSRDNRLLHVYGDSDKFFKSRHGEIATEVTKMVVLPLQLPLNTALHRARREQKSIVYTGIKIEHLDTFYRINLKVIPPRINEENSDFFLVEIRQEVASISTEVEAIEEFQVSNEAQRRILELESELQHTRENLQALVEELETTNEEQQASNEELTSSNEELQSTNEELHSVNEELHTVNSEYQIKIQELIQLNNDIDNLLYSTDIGVIFLDSKLRIRKFTPAASVAVSIRQIDVNRPLKDFSLKIDCPQLLTLLEQVLETQEPLEIEVQHQEEELYLLMRINPYRTEDLQNDGIVISFIKIDEIKAVQEKLETTLAAKERQLAAIETASDGIAILNNDRFTYLNQAHLEIFGYSEPEELIGQSWRILYNTDELARFEREVFPVVAKQGRWQGITKAKHKDGHLFDEELTLTFTKTGDLICVCRDVSDRLKTQRTLENSKIVLEQRVAQRTQILAKQSDRLKQLHRLSTNHYQNLEALFTDYLKTGCQMLGLSTGIISRVEDCIYQIVAVNSPLDLEIGYRTACKDTYCAEVVETLSTIAFARVSEITSMQNHPVYLNLKLESFVGTPILVNGNLYGTLNFSCTKPKELEFSQQEREIIELMAKDIGQSISFVQSQAAIKSSEQRFRSTFEQSAVGIAYVNTEGSFVKVNQRFGEILGYQEDELLQKGFADITEPQDLAPDLKYVRQILAGEINSYRREKRYVHKNGSIVWAHLTVSAIKDDLGEPEYLVAIVEDISDRKQAETALEANKLSQQKLQLVNQAKDSFIAHMNHELRTPLNSILGFSNILQKSNSLNPKELNAIDIVHQSGQHLLTLINDLLDFSKITANKLELELQGFDLGQFIDDIATIFQLRAREKGLIFQLEVSPAVPKAVKADITRLRQVLYNLLSNAIKFTERGSVILKVTRPVDDSRQTKAAAPVQFLVKDTGVGIPRDKFADIFTPFSQLQGNRGNQQGTGLGLAICRDIIQLMGSEIQLESELSVGSKFWFDLKLEQIETSILATSSQPSLAPSSRLSVPQKILVVDDNNANRNLLLHYLEPLGFIVAEAENGEVGLAIARNFKPDAILVDLLMPVMDGREMIANIEQEQSLENTVVIIISASIQSQANLSIIKGNHHGFLVKPVNLDQLLTLLSTHLQLKWQPSQDHIFKDSLPNIIAPPQQQLAELLELVNLGNLTAIETQANYLETLDTQYIPFVREVLKLVVSCQQSKLERFISQYISTN